MKTRTLYVKSTQLRGPHQVLCSRSLQFFAGIEMRDELIDLQEFITRLR